MLDNNFMIKLVARRKKDSVESEAFDFHYELHDAAVYMKTVDDYSFQFQCIFCDQNPDTRDSNKLVKTLEVARPGSKRKTLPAKRLNPKHGRISTDSETSFDNSSPMSYLSPYSSATDQSPDSGIQTSPFQVTFSIPEENIEFHLTTNIDGLDTDIINQPVEETSCLESAGFTSTYIQ